MVEEQLILDNATDFGEIVIAPEVIEIIIGIATAKVEGVVGMRGSLAKNISEKFGKKDHGKGINIQADENGFISVDIYSYLSYGVNVPKVALDIQDKVKKQVLYMTGIELDDVNVHVVAIVPEKDVQADLSDLLEDKEIQVNE